MSHLITLLGKPGCHLCDVAREVIARVAGELGAVWEERDVRADPDDLIEYAERIPVILIDGREHGHFRVEEDRLRKALSS